MPTHKLLIRSLSGPLARHSTSRALLHSTWEAPDPPTPLQPGYWNYWIYWEGQNNRMIYGNFNDCAGHTTNIAPPYNDDTFTNRGIEGGNRWCFLKPRMYLSTTINDSTTPPILRISDMLDGYTNGTFDIAVPWNTVGYQTSLNDDILMELRYISFLQWVPPT